MIETRTRRNYYDVDAVHQAFGEDAHDRLMEDTDGWGALKREEDGSFSRVDHRGVKHEATEQDFLHYVGGTESDEDGSGPAITDTGERDVQVV